MDNDKQFRVKFVNKTRRDIFLFWVNFKGSFEKFCKVKGGEMEEIDTFTNHVWLAMKKKKKRPFLMNRNFVYFASPEVTTVNIEPCPSHRKNRQELMSPAGGQPVVVKFINRTKRNAYLQTVSSQGQPSSTKVLSPGKCWSAQSYQGQAWSAGDDKDRSKKLLLNHGWFYCAVRTRRMKERVVITDKYWMGSSSSSSSSSSSD